METSGKQKHWQSLCLMLWLHISTGRNKFHSCSGHHMILDCCIQVLVWTYWLVWRSQYWDRRASYFANIMGKMLLTGGW